MQEDPWGLRNMTGDVQDTRDSARTDHSTRRDVVRAGTKLAFIAPLVLTFSASQAMAAASTQSCYPAGHACPGAETCCNGLNCVNGTCTASCQSQGGLCFLDSDCCSGDCRSGVCQ